MKTKNIPALVMLLGGTVACIVAYINHYNLQDMLEVVLISLLVFLVLGVIIRLILDSFKIPNDQQVDDDGEVVEKQGDDSEEDGVEVENPVEDEEQQELDA